MSRMVEPDRVADFTAAAERFVALIRAAGSSSRESFLIELATALPTLYAAGARLPAAEPDTDEAPPKTLTRDQWTAIFERLQALLGDIDPYNAVAPFEDHPGDGQMTVGSLADDLADIYRDVDQGLTLFAAGRSQNDVVWEWRSGFWTHWGEHSVNAVRAIHAHLAAAGGP